jgi:hypothetical protein
MSNKMKYKQGDLVLVTHSYEKPELEGSAGMVMGMTEMEFDDDIHADLVDIYEIHVGEEILHCYSDDLSKLNDE